MVDNQAQIYTIEGITAGIIMIVTAYLVISTTTLFTPGDAHITDMQLEQTGNDALAMMDTPDQFNGIRPNTTVLSEIIIHSDEPKFKSLFLNYLNVYSEPGSMDRIQYNATLFYRSNDEIKSKAFSHSREMTGRENSVKVTRLVLVNNTPPTNGYLDPRNQAVLLEVILWRD